MGLCSLSDRGSGDFVREEWDGKQACRSRR